jgi:hypothetical protein
MCEVTHTGYCYAAWTWSHVSELFGEPWCGGWLDFLEIVQFCITSLYVPQDKNKYGDK